MAFPKHDYELTMGELAIALLVLPPVAVGLVVGLGIKWTATWLWARLKDENDYFEERSYGGI